MPRRNLSLLALIAGLSACGSGTIAPIIAEDAHRFDARLLGDWVNPEEAESVTITGDSVAGYRIHYHESDGKESPLTGALGTLGDLLVLDVIPDATALEVGDLYQGLLLRMHTPVIIDSIGEELHFRMIEPDSLKAFLAREPRVVAHLVTDDGVVITAPSEELRRFLFGYLRRPGALGEANHWRRRAP